MAGGKETPRQKMIGMMYLVLTALLALNVSKSILAAFVALEENIQVANLVQADRGNGFYSDVTDEIAATKGNKEMAGKLKKLEYVQTRMDEVDKLTADMIKFIDDCKIEILKAAGEQITTFKDKDPHNIMWKKQEGCTPIRMHLEAVQGMDKYDEPMLVMGISEDIKKPKKRGLELWEKIVKFRADLVKAAGSYKLPGSDNSFTIDVKAINTFKDNSTLMKEVEKMVDGSKANVKDDRQVLIDLYMMLTLQEKNEVHGMKDIHWIGMTFDHCPLVAGVAASGASGTADLGDGLSKWSELLAALY